MTSQKQIESNRRNAMASTGPRSPEGKAVVSHNAISHGLLARVVVLPDEDGAAFERFAEGMGQQLGPVGTCEEALAERVIAATWRLRRAVRIETGMFEEKSVDIFGQERGPSFAFANSRVFTRLCRYETAIDRSFYRAYHALERCQARRAGQTVPAPVAVEVAL